MAISTAVDVSAIARVVGIETEFKNLGGPGVLFLPQRIALLGQGNTASTYALDKKQITSAGEAAEAYGYGSPIHLAALELFPLNNDGVGSIPVTVYPLVDDGSATASEGTITASGTATGAGSFRILVNGIKSAQFTISASSTVTSIHTDIASAISAVLSMPVTAVGTATEVTATSKWKGLSANDIYLEVEGPTDTGITFSIVQPANGLAEPAVDSALAQMGDVWESMILSCLSYNDATTADSLKTFGDGRWGPLTKKPLVAFSGVTEADWSVASSFSDSRKTDKVNSQLVAPGSSSLPFVVAARQLARIVKVANNNPPKDYGGQQADGIVPGADGSQWDYNTKDAAMKRGSSTSDVKSGVVSVSDVITYYHPDGDPLPAYRYVVDIVKLQNVIFNTNLIFESDAWNGAPMLPSGTPTVNPDAKSPSDAIAELSVLADNLELNAIISDAKFTKENIQAEINSQNPKRLDVVFPVKLSGNTNIISATIQFGFYFG